MTEQIHQERSGAAIVLTINGDGLYLERLNGRRSVVRGARGAGRRRARPYRLENAARATLAMTM